MFDLSAAGGRITLSSVLRGHQDSFSKNCAGKPEQDRGEGKNTRLRTTEELSFPSHSFYSLPSCLPTSSYDFLFLLRSTQSFSLWGCDSPQKALCSKLPNKDSRKRRLRHAAFQMHNHSLTAKPKACGIYICRGNSFYSGKAAKLNGKKAWTVIHCHSLLCSLKCC